jgi:hypothetical protein
MEEIKTDIQISLSIPEIDAEIADLRKRAAELNDRADNLETLRELAIHYKDAGKKPSKAKTGRPKVPREPKSMESGTDLPYRGMSTKMAATKYLREKGEPAGSTEIAKALIKGGITTTSKLFHRTVDNILSTAAKRKHSELVKIGKQWGLLEWGSKVGRLV